MGNNIAEKSIGQIFDELVTADIKCFMAQESIMDETLSTEKRLEAAIRAQTQNARRSALIRAIDERLGEADRSVTPKTYYTYFDEKK